ncbi:MAG: Do family serine endopeptidase [Puniceicoccaceae bacterium]
MKSALTYSLVVIIVAILSVAFVQKGGPLVLVNGEGPQREQPTLTIDRTPPGSSNEVGFVTSYADMLEKVTPTVVAVYTSRIVRMTPNQRSRRADPMEEFFRRFYGFPPNEPEGSRPNFEEEERKEPSGVGSGVIISPEGYIITNNHVTEVGRSGEAADEISVRLSDGREYIAELVGRDPATDIAVLKITDPRPFPSISIADSDVSRVGDVVFAVGNPLNIGLTVTSGIISATGRTDLGILSSRRFQRQLSFEDFIQTDAAINRGNSGGPLVDAKGRMIGINTAIISGSGGNIGIGFAIPANVARAVVESLIASGEVLYGYLGVLPDDLTRDLAESFGFNSTAGAIVRQVEPDTPAEKAGLKAGDIILKVDRREIKTASELRTAIALKEPGSLIVLNIFRDGQEMEIEVELGDRATGMVAELNRTESRLPGVTLSESTAELRQRFEIPDRIDGVIVTSITARNIANSRLQEGMVIARVNNADVRTPADVNKSLVDGLNRLYVWSNGVYGFVTVRLQ